MKRHSFRAKNRGKNNKNFSKKKYPTYKGRQSRMKSAFWGRYRTQHCVKESSHGNAMMPQNEGESE